MLSRFYIPVNAEDEEYVRAHDKAITEHMTRQLLLLLQSMRDADLRKEKVSGRGISGDAAIEIADKQEELKRRHDAAFPDAEELAKRIQESTRTNTMVREKN